MSDHDYFPLTDLDVRSNPYPTYHRMRTEAPIYWSEALNGWYVFRYRDVMAGLRDSRLSSSQLEPLRQSLPEADQEQTKLLFDSLARWALLMDPPDHTRLRKLIGAAFVPRMVARMEPRIDSLIDELLDDVQSRGEMDVVRDFAYPLPTAVIAEMLGVPVADRHLFKRWSVAIVRFFGAKEMNLALMLETQQSIVEMNDYFRDMLRERRTAPRDDLLGALLAAREDQDKLSEDELLPTCAMLLFGGHETTTALITNGVLSLLRHPDQLARLRDDPSLAASAVEEILRYESPVQRLSRAALVDFEWDGQRIEKGQRVCLMMGAAGRDPDVFPDPDRLDIARQGPHHLGFGHGIHFCVGAALSRLEARLAFAALLRRLPGLRLATETVEWRDTLLLRTMMALPVAF